MKLPRRVILCILCFIVVACCHPVFARQDSNPLLGMIGKDYKDYFDDYEMLCDTLFSGDSLARVELVRLFAGAAAADPTGEWELDRRRINGHVRFYESRKGGYTPSADYTSERFAADLTDIARTARKKGFHYLYLRSLFNAADAYRIFAQDYERAFGCYLEVAAGLDTLSQRKFPWKLYMYREIADFYYSFREYKDAMIFYRKIVDDPDVTYKNNHRLYPALHGLAQCYRHAEQYDRSDSCLLRILELSAPIGLDRYVWEGIAGGNIGYNYYLRGDLDKALAWMEPALAKMKRPNDDAYTSRLAADIANIYLKRGNLYKGKKYLDIALDYHRRTRIPEKSSRLLGTMAHYYAVAAHQPEVNDYLDSALQAKYREDEAFSGLVLRRVEQRLRAADRKVHERLLEAEKIRTGVYRQTAILITAALAVILALLLLIAFYYHRNRKAYRELVRKSQQWAGVSPIPPETEPADEALPAESESDIRQEVPVAELNATAFTGNSEDAADNMQPLTRESDRTVMEQIEKLVVAEEMYKNPALTLDMLVARAGVNRCYLSGTLNRCTGKNFNTYINEYRVKEAIRLMSEPSNASLTIEALAYEAGFNDRSNFYRIFKKLTGLSPTDFRKNISRK